MRIDAALKSGTDQLKTASSSARLDAEILLAHCLDKQRSYLYTWPEKKLNVSQQAAYDVAIAKRAELYPIAYLIGSQEFWSLTLAVTPEVLIPRADTELLVEIALTKILDVENPQVLELGTGSGAIALALASERSDSQITATDFSQAALKVASENKQSLSINNVNFIQSNWFTDIPIKQYDLIVSNPPYIAPKDAHLNGSIRYEPRSALVSESDGLCDLKTIANNAQKYLKPLGWLIVEHGHDQGELVSSLLQKAAYEEVSCLSDLAGNDRINLALKPKNH